VACRSPTCSPGRRGPPDTPNISERAARGPQIQLVVALVLVPWVMLVNGAVLIAESFGAGFAPAI
jgi:hypothetical protein